MSYLLGYLIIVILTGEFFCFLLDSESAKKLDPDFPEKVRKEKVYFTIVWTCYSIFWPLYWSSILLKSIMRRRK